MENLNIKITDKTYNKLKALDENAWYKLMFCALTDMNEQLFKKIQELDKTDKETEVSRNGKHKLQTKS